MNDRIITVISVLDSESPEKRNALNISLWVSLVGQMLNYPRAA